MSRWLCAVCVCVCTRWGELWIRWRFQYRDWNRTLGEGSWSLSTLLEASWEWWDGGWAEEMEGG